MPWTEPSVESIMTAAPLVVGPTDSLAGAMHTMFLNRVRHAPVCDAGGIVGLLSQRDVYYAQAHIDDGRTDLIVADAMSTFVYVVSPETPVEQVARDLADAKYGAAVVAIGGKPVGVFTTTDALRMLSRILGDLRRDAQTIPPNRRAPADEAEHPVSPR